MPAGSSVGFAAPATAASWSDDVSMTDGNVPVLTGHRQVTDAHLRTLAGRRQVRLVTFQAAWSL